MAESRVERLTRIRAVLEADSDEIEISCSESSGAWCRDGHFRNCTIADLVWLLEQVTGEREYRVDWLRDGTADVWQTIEHPGSLEDALSSLSDLKRTSDEYAFRVLSAPVQVWTVEEETP